MTIEKEQILLPFVWPMNKFIKNALKCIFYDDNEQEIE